MADFRIFTSIRYDPELLKVPSLGFTNIGWNSKSSPFYMLDLHRDRMLRAAIHWDWVAAVAIISGEEGLENFERFLQSAAADLVNGPHRLMITLARDGTLGYETSSLPGTHLNNLHPGYLPSKYSDFESSALATESKVPIKDTVYDIFLDSKMTTKSEFTHYKTTIRDMYNDARKRAQVNPGDNKEVLLVNDDGFIMEGTISTPYFWRNGKWVTPPVPKKFDTVQGSGGNDGTTRRWALERDLVAEEAVLADSLVDGEECWISNGLRGFICGKVRLR
ncbi:aminotransferase [Annulohypoxylon maeteangense]|uniref:aminotransferase n=1 Tax=Annulohypoxylon maeteangense TaxID=1927788 RepID=UPI002008E400|nr:aminotransferase [Annulohypoxylon maeteangense]KAI0885681.1 aminotransferase [Annulohypoxylon maeteangense]